MIKLNLFIKMNTKEKIITPRRKKTFSRYLIEQTTLPVSFIENTSKETKPCHKKEYEYSFNDIVL